MAFGFISFDRKCNVAVGVAIENFIGSKKIVFVRLTLDSNHLEHPVPMVWLRELFILLRPPDVGARAPAAGKINH